MHKRRRVCVCREARPTQNYGSDSACKDLVSYIKDEGEHDEEHIHHSWFEQANSEFQNGALCKETSQELLPGVCCEEVTKACLHWIFLYAQCCHGDGSGVRLKVIVAIATVVM